MSLWSYKYITCDTHNYQTFLGKNKETYTHFCDTCQNISQNFLNKTQPLNHKQNTNTPFCSKLQNSPQAKHKYLNMFPNHFQKNQNNNPFKQKQILKKTNKTSLRPPLPAPPRRCWTASKSLTQWTPLRRMGTWGGTWQEQRSSSGEGFGGGVFCLGGWLCFLWLVLFLGSFFFLGGGYILGPQGNLKTQEGVLFCVLFFVGGAGRDGQKDVIKPSN